jgi:hypothetical protein
MNRCVLSDCVSVADHDPTEFRRRITPQNLWGAADSTIREEVIALPDRDIIHDGHVCVEDGAGADGDIAADHTEGPYDNVFVQLCVVCNNSRGMYLGHVIVSRI